MADPLLTGLTSSALETVGRHAATILALRSIIIDEAEDQHDRHHQGPRDTCPEGICLHAAEQRHEPEDSP